jgi:hypothetical protein
MFAFLASCLHGRIGQTKCGTIHRVPLRATDFATAFFTIPNLIAVIDHKNSKRTQLNQQRNYNRNKNGHQNKSNSNSNNNHDNDNNDDNKQKTKEAPAGTTTTTTATTPTTTIATTAAHATH